MTHTNWDEWVRVYGEHVSLKQSRLLSKKYESEFVKSVPLNPHMGEKFKVNTANEPKQVAYSRETKKVLVSCMVGRKIQIFDFPSLALEKELVFKEQVVEIAVSGQYAFATISDFSHLSLSNNYVVILDLKELDIISMIPTGGQWSKFIKVDQERKVIFVSNWRSNDLSIISFADTQKPKVTQILKCGIAPRGIDITEDGRKCLVACYYSRNIIELEENENKYEIGYIGEPFDFPNYSGNMRDVLISGHYAYVSNMGRNCVHMYSLSERKVVSTWLVGKFPNSIRFLDDENLIISCRESNCFYGLNVKSGLLTCVITTLESPTGLCIADGGFLATGFTSNQLAFFSVS